MASWVEWPRIFFALELRTGVDRIQSKYTYSISPATVDTDMRTLEKEYRLPVFLREGRQRGALTAKGQELQQAVLPIVTAWLALCAVVRRPVSIQQVLAALAVDQTGSLLAAAQLLYGSDTVKGIGQLLGAVEQQSQPLFSRNVGRPVGGDPRGSTPTSFYSSQFVVPAWEFIEACIRALSVAPNLKNTSFGIQMEQARKLTNPHRELTGGSTITEELPNFAGRDQLI